MSPERPCFTVSCNAWKFRSLEFFLPGRVPVEVMGEIEASVLHPEVRRRTFRDALIGRRAIQGYSLIAQVNLPHSQRISTYRERGDPYHTVYHVSGWRSEEPIPFGEHHRKGRQPVVVAHYPRLEALLERAVGPEVVSESAVEDTRARLRQEVRFRREAIRRCMGPGSAGRAPD